MLVVLFGDIASLHGRKQTQSMTAILVRGATSDVRSLAWVNIYIGISSTREQSALALVIYDEDGLKVRDHVIDLDKPVNNTELEMIALIEGVRVRLG